MVAAQTHKWAAHNSRLSKRAVEILRLLAEGRSDREIAEQLVMTIGTVKWYNRQIYRMLGVRSRTQAIAVAKERGLLGPAATSLPAWAKPSLPTPSTPIIGRRREIDLVLGLLGTFRLLTLTGTGGIGKTRLALQVAEDVRDIFPDGVYFVDLAPLTDPARVINAIAATLEVQENAAEPVLQTLKRTLAPRRLLLLMDNFEHVIEAAPMVSALLAACPHLKVLVTSRESLHLHGEQEFPVATLSVPQVDAGSLKALVASEAGLLFMQRAQMTQPDFSVTDESASAVAKICAQLDGLPLAIELAAARTKVLSPQTLLARLTSRLDTLTGGPRDLPSRQQTLHNTIAWSYHLLTEGEQRLFARLAVFRGGCSLEAAEAVCDEGLSMGVLDGLESLVNKNLIQRTVLPNGDVRFSMLETLHEYARGRLEASGEATEIARRRATYIVDFAERVEPQLRQAQQWLWFGRLEADHGNLQASLRWSLDEAEGDLTLGARLAGALGLFWTAYGYHAEGRQWTNELLTHLETIPTQYHAALLLSAGRMAWLQNDLDAARDDYDRALQVARTLGDQRTVAWALISKCLTLMHEPEAALVLAEEGLALFRQLHYQPGIGQALNAVGELARLGGDDARAQQAYEECLMVSQTTGEVRRIRCMFAALTFLAEHRGEHDQARELGERGLRIALESNNKLDIADSLAILAGVLGTSGQPERAVRLLAASDVVLERMAAAPQPTDLPEFERTMAAVRAQLDSQTFATAWTEGRALSLEQAVALVHERENA